MMLRPLKNQLGQAMTEFVIAAAFVMVPLFLLVPTVGKYIDMKLAAVQAARYTTWEYSAHYVDLKDQPAGFSAVNASQLPKKSLTQVKNEADRRFYSDTTTVINTAVDKGGYQVVNANPLWTFHNGLPMYKTGAAGIPSGSNSTPDKLKVFNGIIGVIGAGLNYIAVAFDALGINAGFDAINPDGNLTVDGKYSVSLVLPAEEAPSYAALHVNNTQPLFGQDLNLQMQAKSGLLTETWGAGGKAHTVYQAGGLVPTTLIGAVFESSPFDTIISIVSTVLLSPELDTSSLKFGYPVTDPTVMDIVPAGALGGASDVNCPGGYCEN